MFTEPQKYLSLKSIVQSSILKVILKHKVKTTSPLPSNGNCYQYKVVAGKEVQHWPL